jgi:hypothetical protein
MKLVNEKVEYKAFTKELSFNDKVKFIKACLKDMGYSKELIAYLLSTYDLDSFINSFNGNHLELASHFLGHARQVKEATSNY